MRIKKTTSLLIIILLITAVTFVSGLNVIAQETQETAEENNDQEKISDLQEEIDKYVDKLKNLQSREESLSKEIETADGQIYLTQLRIQNSIATLRAKENEIQKLSGDIEELGVRINKLEKSIDYQEMLLGQRMRSRYKNYETSPVMVIFGSSTFNTLVQKTEYLKVLGIQDRRLMDQMSKTKTAYGQQKNLFEDKKEKEESLKRQVEVEKANLEGYRGQLEDQKFEKEKLLELTQNDETKYKK
ncbi:MAG: Peptidase M23, partial [candidate division WWE3 bacterium GW2011_GWA1_41_8]